jgi:hypothetical protein
MTDDFVLWRPTGHDQLRIECYERSRIHYAAYWIPKSDQGTQFICESFVFAQRLDEKSRPTGRS